MENRGIEDIYYVTERDSSETMYDISVINIDKFLNDEVDERLLRFLLECKDPVMKDIFIEEHRYSEDILNAHGYMKDVIIESIMELHNDHKYVESFTWDEVNIVIPSLCVTIDRLISINPIKVIVLLRTLE